MAFSLHPNLELVDVHTTSDALAEKLLTEYGGKIKEENYTRTRIGGETTYSFIGLCWGETRDFFDKSDAGLLQTDAYEIRDNSSGEFRRVRLNGASYTDKNSIEALLKERFGV